MNTKLTLPCKHVSHTAWLVAAFRAQESKRPDAHFCDPLAEKLLGDLEEEYLQGFSKELRTDPWILTVRTVYIDRLIEKYVEKGVGTVLNLGAGLDTRPYRLKLPPTTRWIEADYQELIVYKNDKIRDEKPLCKLERIGVDLSVERERLALFARIKDSESALVLTEGLLGYLSESNVDELAESLFAHNAFRYWLLDVFNKSFLSALHGGFAKDIGAGKEGDVQFKFIPHDTAQYLRPYGWNLKEFVSFKEGSLALNRFPRGFDAISLENDLGLKESGVSLFERRLL